MRAAGLGAPLRFDVGGYGSDHIERAELVAIAMRRAEAAGIAVDPAQVWVDRRHPPRPGLRAGQRRALSRWSPPARRRSRRSPSSSADITVRALDAPEVADLIDLIAAPAAVG